MSKIDELIAGLCPDGVDYRKLDSMLSYEQPGKYLVKSTDYSPSFRTPVLTAGKTFILGYTDEEEGIYNASVDNPVILLDDFTTANRWITFPFKVKSSATKLLHCKDESLYSFKYLFYLLQVNSYSPMEHSRQWISAFSQIEVPVPPIEVQREVVRIIDSFAELEARRAQYAYYRDKLLDFTERESVSWLKLGEFATVNTGSKPKTFDESAGLYEFINAGTTPSGYLDDFNTEGDTVTTPSRGQGGIGYVGYSANRFWCGPLCYRIKSSDGGISNKYLYYVMQGRSWKIRTLMKEGGTPAVNARDLKQLEIPVPPLSEQRHIVDILDRFEALTTSLSDGLPAEIEARRQQYEHYRDKLLDFSRKVA